MFKRQQKIARLLVNSIVSFTVFHKLTYFLLNKLEILLKKEKLKSGPLFSVFSPAATCNYRCSFCESNSFLEKAERAFPNVISIDDFRRLNFYNKSTLVVNFYGNIGEPLINKDFSKISSFLKNKGIYLSATTNGSMLSERLANELIDMGFDELLVSFHAGKKKTYEILQNKFFDLVATNVKYLACKRKKIPKIFFNFALNRINANDISDLIILAKDLKIDGILVNHYYHCKNNFKEDMSFYNSPEEGNKFIDLLYDLGEKSNLEMMPEKRPYLVKFEKLPDSNQKLSEKECKCLMPYRNLNFYGSFDHENTFDVCVCNRFFLFRLNYKEFGEQNVDVIWNHPTLQYLRKTLGRNPVCKFCQSAEAPILRNLDNGKYRSLRDEAIKLFFEEAAAANGEVEEVKGLQILKDNIYKG